MDSVSACQASYLPMTRFNKAGNQVTSASRINYINMSSSIHHLYTNFMVTPTSLSDHCIVTCSIQQPTSSKISSWTKILPNTISISHFRHDFLQTFTMLDDFPSLENRTEFKTKLVSNFKFHTIKSSSNVQLKFVKLRNSHNILRKMHLKTALA